MTFELLCMTMIALLVGLAVTFNGYRFFLFLLPVWAFIFGFGLAAAGIVVQIAANRSYELESYNRLS